MIVKRLTQALQRQDWAVVSIEFVLVVVGVLLAFQINEYANRREAANEREGATERLLVEAEESVAYMRQTVDFQQGLVDDLNFALIRVQSGQGRPEDQKRMLAGLSRARSATPLAPPSSVYDDLVASGTFGYAREMEGIVNLASLGGILPKTITLHPRNHTLRL